MFQLEPGYIIWESITAFAFLIVLRRFAAPTILKGLHDRSETIRGSIEQAEAVHQSSEDVLRSAQEIFAAGENEKRKIIQQGQASAEQLKATAIEAAKSTTERMQLDIVAEIQRLKEQAIRDLHGSVVEWATNAAAVIIDQHMDKSKHTELVNAAIRSIPEEGSTNLDSARIMTIQ